MSFNIDITAAPLTLAEIKEKRDQAVSERAIFRKKNIRFMVAMFSIVVVYVTLMIVFVIPQMGDADPEWGIITYFFPYFTFFIFIVGNELHTKRIEKPSRALDKLIASLNEVTADEINSVVNGKEQSGEVVSYLEQVAAQGRLLVRAEMEAIHS